MCVKCKRRKKILANLKVRGGLPRLDIEMDRWLGVSREERVCRNCQSGEVEGVEHWVMRCTSVAARGRRWPKGRV